MKKILLIITAVIIIVSIPIFVFYLGQQQELRSKAAPATTLTLVPDKTSITVGETVICKVMINTGENNVASAKISLVFDQTKFEALSITNSTLAPRILTQAAVGGGTAGITVAAESTAKPITGQGEIAVLRMKATQPSMSPLGIQFAADTFVAGIGENSPNVLVSSQPAMISVTGDAPSSATTSALLATSPTTSPSPTATPIPAQPEMLYTQPASESACTLTVFAEATRSGIPLIRGTATPSATITVVIHTSPAQTLVTTADASGIWSVTPKTALATGTYTLVGTCLDTAKGNSDTLSSSFTIGGGIGGGDNSQTDTATGAAIPTSGSIDTLLVLLTIGSICISIGTYVLVKPIYERS